MKLSKILIFLKWYFKKIVSEYRDNKMIQDLIKNNEDLTIRKDVKIRSSQNLRLGKNVYIDSGALLHCGGMEWCDFKGMIAIGDNSYIGPYSVLCGAGEIYIGKSVLTAPGVIITAQTRSFADIGKELLKTQYHYKPVIIEDNIAIGSNAVILPGVRIGHNSIIGAGAVVTKDIPPFSVAVGVPARVVKR